ncbi:MAG: SAM-dependent methyltransferase [Chloroflexota bacterium]
MRPMTPQDRAHASDANRPDLGDDFRRELYAGYVSTFKQSQASMDPSARRAYGTWCRRCYLPLIQDLDRSAPILEIGCGAGYFMEFLMEQGFRDVSGLDISEEQIVLARARGLKAEVGDVFTILPAHPGAFAAIVAIDFLEHFSRTELTKLTPAIRAALVPGGRFITQTPNGQALHGGAVIHGDLTHLTIFTPRSLEQLLRRYGFLHIESTETPLPGSSASWVLRRTLWSLIRATANVVKRIEGVRTEHIWTQNFVTCARTPLDMDRLASQR